MKAKLNKHMASPHCSCRPQHTAPLLLPMPRRTAPAAHTAPHRSCRPQCTAPLLLPMPCRTAPAAHAAPHRSCCPCHATLLLLPAPRRTPIIVGRHWTSLSVVVRRYGQSFLSLSVIMVMVSCCRCCRLLSVVVVVVDRCRSCGSEKK